MEQKKNNQQRSRKYGGTSSFVDGSEPSKAPRQDEDGREFIGSSERDQPPAYNNDETQGVSNRPANAEHAFPESGEAPTEPEARESVDATPKQLGGNRGGV